MSAVSIAIKHIGETPRSIRELKPELPRALEQILQKALSKDPADRYQSASEMAADLKRSLTNPRGGFVRNPVMDAQRRKARVRNALAGLLLAAVLGAMVLHHRENRGVRPLFLLASRAQRGERVRGGRAALAERLPSRGRSDAGV